MSDLNNETTMMDVVAGVNNENDQAEAGTLENVVGFKNENDQPEASTLVNFVVGVNSEIDQPEASILENVIGVNIENDPFEASTLENVVGVNYENDKPEASTLENVVVRVNKENNQPEASTLENIVVGVNNEHDQPEVSTLENFVVGVKYENDQPEACTLEYVVGVNNENDQLEASTLENFVIGVNNENDQPEASTPEKRKREWKLRSVAWEHFTKLINDDGIYDKCKCIHCNKLFSHTGGTTHLLRHIRDGSCPEYNKEKTDMPDFLPSEPRKKKAKKLNQETMHPSQEILPVSCYDGEAMEAFEDEYGSQTHTPARRRRPNKFRGESSSWMNELRGCVGRLVDLTGVQNGGGPVMDQDYSIGTAIRFLNEIEDIPQSSEMYLDALELLKNGSERECFICLPQEPRRRWLQRMLHRHYPLRYDYDF